MTRDWTHWAEVASGLVARAGRRRLVTGLVAAMVLVLLGGTIAAVVVQPGRRPPATIPGVPSTTVPPAPPVLRAATGPEPSAASVARALAGPFRNAAMGTIGASVIDVTTGQGLYGRRSAIPVLPASVTKLVTASAILRARGPAYRLTTRVVAGPKPGELILVGGGDPTLQTDNNRMYPQAARLDTLAAATRRALHGTRPTRIMVDSTLFDGPRFGPGWDPDIVPGGDAGAVTALMADSGFVNPDKVLTRYPQPDIAAGQRFARMLGLSGRDVARATAPHGARQVAAVSSPPLVHLIEMMLQRSDNMIAETLAHDVAVARGQRGSFAAGAAASSAQMKAMGLNVSLLHLADGSGLSRRDRISPSFLAYLLTRIGGHGGGPNLWPILGGLPVAGYSGTLDFRYASAATRGAVGLVRGKTGSLSGTSTLAGLVVDAHGRVLAFAMMCENIASNFDADAGMDVAAAALGRL